MRKFFKQFFCRHVYKLEKAELLENKRELTFSIQGLSHYSNYTYYALYKKCVKCEKEKITSKRILEI